MLLTGGLSLALAGMAWLSQLSADTPYFPGLAIPMLLLGIGMGAAFTPLTAAGSRGVAQRDAGAASGLVNVAHQLGGSLGLGVLVTVFAGAGGDLVHGVSEAITGSAVFLALALAVVVFVMRRPAESATPVGAADAARG